MDVNVGFYFKRNCISSKLFVLIQSGAEAEQRQENQQVVCFDPVCGHQRKKSILKKSDQCARKLFPFENNV